jgi:hypothetical protein
MMSVVAFLLQFKFVDSIQPTRMQQLQHAFCLWWTVLCIYVAVYIDCVNNVRVQAVQFSYGKRQLTVDEWTLSECVRLTDRLLVRICRAYSRHE